jgi:hypothetical protein
MKVVNGKNHFASNGFQESIGGRRRRGKEERSEARG